MIDFLYYYMMYHIITGFVIILGLVPMFTRLEQEMLDRGKHITYLQKLLFIYEIMLKWPYYLWVRK